MDWGSLWDQAKTQVDQGLQQLQQVGVPVIKSAIEQQALDLINKQHQETKAEAQKQVGAVVSASGDSAIGNALKQAALPSVVESNKWLIIGGIVILVGIGYLISKKG